MLDTITLPKVFWVWLLFLCTRFTYLLLHKMLHETYADHLMLRWKLDLSYSRHWGILREEDLYDLHFTAEIPALTNPQKQKLYQESVSILFEWKF